MSNILNKIKNRIHFYRYLHPSKLDAIFVVSTGRTGTQFFESFFNQLNNHTHAVHEPQPDFFDLSMNKIRNNWSDKKIEEYINENRQKYLIQLSKYRVKHYVECNPFLPLLLPNIKNVFKKAKFIIITRHRETYINSALNKKPLENEEFFAYGEKDKRKRIAASDFPKDRYCKEWNSFNRKEKFAWYWSKCNEVLIDFMESNSSSFLYLRFEDIFSNDEKTKIDQLNKIFRFIGLKNNNVNFEELLSSLMGKKNQTEIKYFEAFNEWNQDEKNKFYEITDNTNIRLQTFYNKNIIN